MLVGRYGPKDKGVCAKLTAFHVTDIKLECTIQAFQLLNIEIYPYKLEINIAPTLPCVLPEFASAPSPPLTFQKLEEYV